jgi:hypothetical protein
VLEIPVQLFVVEPEAHNESVIDLKTPKVDGNLDDAARPPIQQRADAESIRSPAGERLHQVPGGKSRVDDILD